MKIEYKRYINAAEQTGDQNAAQLLKTHQATLEALEQAGRTDLIGAHSEMLEALIEAGVIPTLPAGVKLVKQPVATDPLKPETKRFSAESRRSLARLGYTIVPLTGVTFAELEILGKEAHIQVAPIQQWHRELVEKSLKSEVAVNLDNPFIPVRNRSDRLREIELTSFAEFAAQTKLKIPRVEVIRGTAIDYAELLLNLLSKRGLMVKPNILSASTTQTPANYQFYVIVSSIFNRVAADGVNSQNTYDAKDMPLIVPQ